MNRHLQFNFLCYYGETYFNINYQLKFIMKYLIVLPTNYLLYLYS
jgi:hypothetical protein